jgi:hypothetical protein
MTTRRWDPFPEYRPVSSICIGDQTSDGDQYGWSTVYTSVPCSVHENCHVLSYLADRVGVHRPPTSTILSRLPFSAEVEYEQR